MKKFLFFFFILPLFVSCNSDIEEVNVDEGIATTRASASWTADVREVALHPYECVWESLSLYLYSSNPLNVYGYGGSVCFKLFVDNSNNSSSLQFINSPHITNNHCMEIKAVVEDREVRVYYAGERFNYVDTTIGSHQTGYLCVDVGTIFAGINGQATIDFYQKLRGDSAFRWEFLTSATLWVNDD